MRTISNKTFKAFHDEGLRQLRQRILQRWKENLNFSATEVGEDGRNEVLDEIEALSHEDPKMTEGNLMALADLRVVEVANHRRNPPD